MEELINEYLAQLNDKEKKAYEIAKEHLKTSFSIKKSIGFIQWLKEKNVKK